MKRGMIEINTGPRTRVFVLGLVQLIDSLIGICSLGFLYSNMSMDYLCWSTKREMKKELGREQVQILKDMPTTKDLPSVPWSDMGKKNEEDN